MEKINLIQRVKNGYGSVLIANIPIGIHFLQDKYTTVDPK